MAAITVKFVMDTELRYAARISPPQ